MTLSILEPIEVLPVNVDSNIPLEIEWTAGTYTLGQQRRIDDTLYEVVSNSTDKSPLEVTNDWVNIGPAKRYAAFDLQVGADKYRILETVSSNADSVEFTITGLTRIGQISFFGLKATRIEIDAVSNGQTILNVSNDLTDATDYNGSIWAWMFYPKDLATTYSLRDVNIPTDSTITIRILNPGAVSEVSSIALGLPTEYGNVLVSTSKKLRSRTTQRLDGLLATLIPRRPTYVISYQLSFDSEADPFWRKIESLQGKPAVFSGSSKHPEFTAYGYIENANGSTVSHTITKGSVDLGTI